MKRIPKELEIFSNENGVYLEIEGFIKFLRDSNNIPAGYEEEAKYLKRIAQFLEDQLQEAIIEKQLIHGEYDTDKPN